MIKFYLSIKFFIFIFIPPSFSALRHKKAPRVGLEPTTPRLTAECSTIELSRIIPSAFAETVILFDYTLKTTH